jgi:two-component system chemotaxis response regulator CheB
LPAAVLIVQHVGRQSALTQILQRCRPSGNVVTATDGDTIEPGRVYVAPPDRHVVLDDGRVQLRKSPRENLHRPSVDVLFRSAARAHGAKVVGVVLTGALNDGASGLFAIKSRGGVAVVHDPREAMMPDMPENAIRAVEVDYVLPLAKIPPLLVKLANQPVAVRTTGLAPGDDAPASDAVHPDFVCPECDGPLTAQKDGDLVGFRCKIGHRFSLEGLSDAHAEALERGLWIAVRVLDDRAAIQRLRAKTFQEHNAPRQSEAPLEIAAQAEKAAKVLREILERL